MTHAYANAIRPEDAAKRCCWCGSFTSNRQYTEAGDEVECRDAARCLRRQERKAGRS